MGVFKIEQTFFFTAISIRRERDPAFKPGRSNMKIQPALLFCGVVLVAAGPVWADKIPYPRSAKESPKIETSARLNRSSVPEMNAPVNAGFRAEPTPISVFIDTPEASNAFDVRDSESSAALGPLFHPSSDLHIHHGILDDRDSDERISSSWHAGKSWDKEGEGKRDHDTDENEGREGIVTASIPEPGSLSLLLLGLAAVGFTARRRRDLTLTR
jgi:PEP-CTERM motif